MGTKRWVASAVSEVINATQNGILLDAFSGMCAVGEAVGPVRQIWNNDIQIFASNVARALFVSTDSPLSALSCGDIHFEQYKIQRDRLVRVFRASLDAEDDLLRSQNYSDFESRRRRVAELLGRDIEGCRTLSPHLFATTYSGTFFGIRQAVDADAIVTSIQAARRERKISRDEALWGVVGLGRALLKVANSTGHFAQYLKPKQASYRRYLALRRRSLWAEWISSLVDMSPIGDPFWRRGNKAFQSDALNLIPRLARKKADVAVIYADPPYTDDQYSRFYHVLETLCLYDYPKVSGAGLYRPARFTAPFSLKAQAPKALGKLIHASSRTGADLVLSYPTNGLVNKKHVDIEAELKKHFKHVEIARSVPHKHSTFGASKGAAKSHAMELIYLARSA
jgi:adenine-specific DNA-methyltransferase